MNLEQLLGKELQDFEDRVFQYFTELGIFEKVRFLSADHLGLRLKDVSDIQALKNDLEKNGSMISSAVVNGREILIYKMILPIKIKNWSIPCIELPYPKLGHSYPDGWEHIEMVIPSSAMTLDELRHDFQVFFPDINIESLKQKGQYSEDEPKSESDQLPNPTIALRKNKITTIKFHARTIEEIVS